MTSGWIVPQLANHSPFQRLCAQLQQGECQTLLLSGAPGSGKSQWLATLSSFLLEQGWLFVSVAATPLQPLSSGRLLMAFASLLEQQGLQTEAAMVNNGALALEERFAVLFALMQQRLACVVVLDGLETILQSANGQFLDPGMAFFWHEWQKRSPSASRLLVASRLLPAGNGETIATACLRHEQLAPGREVPQPAFQGLLAHLDAESRQALRAMTLFHYPMPVDAYRAVTKWSAESLQQLLQQLHSLAVAQPLQSSDGALCWALHPLLRQIVRTESAEEKQRPGKLLTRIGRYMCRLAAQASEQTVALPRWTVAAEAIGYFLQAVPLRRRNLFAEIMHCAEPLSEYLLQAGYYWELERLQRQLLAVGSHPRLLYRLALALLRRQQVEEAEGLLRQVCSFSEEQFGKEHALALFELAGLALQDAPEVAKERLLQALAINQRLAESSGQAVCHAHLGLWGLRQADHLFAQTHLQEALLLCRKLNDEQGITNLLPWTGELHWRVGNILAARDHFQEALQRICAGSNSDMEAQLRHRLAVMDLGEENYDAALAGFVRALQLNRASGNRRGEAVIFFQLGRLAKAKGEDFASLQFLGLSQKIGQESGDPDAGQLLILFRELAVTVLRLQRVAAQVILDGVWLSYCQDQGDSLLRQVFGEELLQEKE